MLRTNKNYVLYAMCFAVLFVVPLFVVGMVFSAVYYGFFAYPLFIPLFVVLFYVLYLVVFLLESTVVFFFLRREDLPGTYNLDEVNRPVLVWGISYMLLRSCERLFDLIFVPQEISRLVIFRLAGAPIGRNCLLAGDISDPLLIEIGDNCVIGGQSMVVSHAIEGNKLTLQRTVLQDNVTVGAGSVISAGAVLENDVMLGSLSFVKKGQTLEAKGIYGGVPARRIQE